MDRHFDFHARRQVIAEHSGNAACGLTLARRLAGNFHQHHLPGPGAAGAARRDQHVLTDPGVVRPHEMDAALGEITSHQFPRAVFQHFHDGTFGTTATVEARNPHQHLIARQHPAHLAAGQKNIRLTASGHHKTVTLGMSRDTALDQIHLVQRAIAAGAVLDDLPIADHGAQATAQRLDLLVVPETEFTAQLCLVERPYTVRQQLQDVFAAGNGLFVARRFPLRLRIILEMFVPHRSDHGSLIRCRHPRRNVPVAGLLGRSMTD